MKSDGRHLRGFFLLVIIALGEVSCLLLFVTLLVLGGLLIVRLAVGLAQSLPLVTKLLADLACMGC